MSWRDTLRPATWRGVPMHVEADDMAGGRRGQLHEYPQRDRPWFDDLGRKARTFAVTAYVIGADYMAARDALLAACEQGGPGTLVHPWLGSLTVVLTDYRCSQSQAEGGMARFALSFSETAELSSPSATAATDSQLATAAAAAGAASVASAGNQISIAELPDSVEGSAITSVQNALAVVQHAWGVASPAGIIASVQTLLRTPAALAQGIADLYVGITTADYGELLRSAFGALDLLPRLPRRRSTATGTPAAVQTSGNDAAVQTLVRQQLLVMAAASVARMPELPVADDAEQLAQRIAAAIDGELATATDGEFAALVDLRGAVLRDVATRARDSARLRSITPVTVLPVAVLAHDLYADATRADEILTRNRIRHPLFVPPRALQVLST
ncbi:DNA circularization protein [Derxia gummosa]|uniref:DNA circularization protein n=1 Tax=Derxia gummosa DSM 723 TaxID=1121388 RepID=A0A8B6X2Z9_9BURK|nr:DNA circularization N-terminal domain-containing protein [Derxia gummosa]